MQVSIILFKNILLRFRKIVSNPPYVCQIIYNWLALNILNNNFEVSQNWIRNKVLLYDFPLL
jgi:hypothetical protein